MTLAKALHVTFIVCALLTGLAGGAQAQAQAVEPRDLIDKARMTLDDVKKDKEFGNTQSLLKRAKAVFIVPSLFKGGFFVGGEGGSGVYLIRQSDGSWSYPAFYTLASASFGLQIGAETSELVLIVLSDKASNAFMSDEFKVGVDAGLAIVTLGSGAEAATTSNLKADIVVWSSSTGAYAGLTLNGSVIKPRMEYNNAYYGKTAMPADIVLHGTAKNPQADYLRKTLASLG